MNTIVGWTEPSKDIANVIGPPTRFSTLPTPKRRLKQIAISTLHRLLTNPYYKGSHEAIVPEEVCYQVQAVLDAHASAADAIQVYDHYLKGTVY